MAKLAAETKPCGEASGGGKSLWQSLVAELVAKLVARELVARPCGEKS